MNKMTEYRKLVNEAKERCDNITWPDLEVRLHSIKALCIVSETTKLGTTSMTFSVRSKAEQYRSKLLTIIKKTKYNAWVKFRTVDFYDESIQKPGTPDKKGNYLNERPRRREEPVR